MIKKHIFILSFFCPFLFLAQQTSIIPQPVSLVMQQCNFVIDNNTTIKYNSSDKSLKAAADFFSDYLKNISPFVLPHNKKTAKAIELKIAKTAEIGDEGYLLNVSPSSIIITANTRAGIAHAMQTLL